MKKISILSKYSVFNVVKRFYVVTYAAANKLDRWYPSRFFLGSLIFSRLPKVEHIRVPYSLGRLLSLPRNIRLA